jgi:hypothetical protein
MFNKSSFPVEVFIDQGTKFWRDLQDLCERALIDHWTIPQDHPEANGLTKQMV